MKRLEKRLTLLREELDFERSKIEGMKQEAEEVRVRTCTRLASLRNCISLRLFRKDKCRWFKQTKRRRRTSYLRLIVEFKSGRYAWLVKENWKVARNNHPPSSSPSKYGSFYLVTLPFTLNGVRSSG